MAPVAPLRRAGTADRPTVWAGWIAAIGIAATLVAAAPAMADSLAFVRGHDVWLANQDGSGQYQVTLDGTAAAPYESPSQADDGTVVAIRETPGQRRQIYRMTESGRLLNAPINTPAPGTGAIDGKVSPDGRLVAYWFVTTVGDPICSFCVNVSNEALLSYSDRFTHYDEVGTPNTGGWPSWVSNDTIVIGSGSATQWYYRLGMSEAAEWFADSDFVASSFQTLLDAEAAPTGDRLAVVRGDNQETILVLKMNGAPPGKPTIANDQCALLAQPAGKFVDPTWSSDGRLLAWQEDDGVWTMSVPADLADCAGFGTPVLRIPGASAPDLSPAVVAPGARPPCANPGNPVACAPIPTPTPTPACCTPATADPTKVITDRLRALLSRESRALRRLKIGGLLRRRQVKASFEAPEAGRLAASLAIGATTIASAKLGFPAATTKTLVLKLSRKGVRTLRKARRVRATLVVRFTPSGRKAIALSARLRLGR